VKMDIYEIGCVAVVKNSPSSKPMDEVGPPLTVSDCGVSNTVYVSVFPPVLSMLAVLLILRCVYDYFSFLCYLTRAVCI
jgi:hypothetical protein